ncbi:MAG: gliding motility-associated C-terminal domain-containing protein [Cyclobacteriaceae bacterium]|nr:gliding motility-associated C-terminal domain-containing protein [Cyclobacteriaceae bacterium]
MKRRLLPRFFFLTLLLGITAFAADVLAQAPVVVLSDRKDACRDLLDGSGNPGTDGTLDNGSINVTVTSGIPPISLFIIGPTNIVGVPLTLGVPFTAPNLKPGAYVIVVQDGNPADFNGNFLINGTTDINAGITPGFPVNSTSCGTPNGQIAINVTGGTSSYSYAWTATNGFTSTSEDIAGLSAGDYTVVIRDNGTNCTQTIGPITVLEPPAPTNAVLSLTGTSPVCAGESTTLRVDITGGAGPFTLTVSGLGTVSGYTSGANFTVAPLVNTTYTLTNVTDVNGCPADAVSGSVNISVNPVPNAPAVTFTPNTYCVGASIVAPFITTPAGGSTYQWYDDAGLTTLLITTPTPTIAQLGFSSAAATTKTVFVTETNSFNCAGPATAVTLTVNPVPTAPAVTFNPSAYCVGAVITPPVITTPIGGSTYTWYSDVSLSTVIATSATPTNAALGFSSAAPIVRTVFVTETNASGCPGPATSVTLTISAVPVAPAVTFSPSSYCVGNAIAPPIITTPVGGSTYNWYDDAGLTTLLATTSTPTNLQLGFTSASVTTKTVFVTETNASNCTSTATAVTLSVNPIPAAPTITFNPSSYCVGNAITAPTVNTPVGGSTYTWYNDASLTTVLATGAAPGNGLLGFTSAAPLVRTVFVTERNSSGCEGAPTGVTLTVSAVPVAPAVTFTPNSFCVGDAIAPPVITAPVAGSTYSWFNDAGLTVLLTTGAAPTNLALGFNSVAPIVRTVFVVETNSGNCTGAATPITLTVNAIPAAPSIAFSPSTYCVGESITPPSVNAPVGGSTYTWYGDASLTMVLTTGTAPTNAVLGFSSAAANTRTVFITQRSASGCESPAASITLTVNAVPPSPAITFSPATYCVGQTIAPPFITSPVATSTYTWYANATLTTVLATGTNPTNVALGFSSAVPGSVTIFVTETNSSNCQSAASPITLTINPIPPAPAITFTPATYCVGDAITAPFVTTPGGSSTYAWYSDAGLTTQLTTGTNPTNAQLGFSSATASTTTIFVTETISGCASAATPVILTVNALPTATVSGTVSICNGQSASLTFAFTGTGPWNYSYSDGVTTFSAVAATSPATVSVNPITTTSYSLVSVSDVNCVGTVAPAPVTITVDNPPSVGLGVAATIGTVCSGGSSNIEVAASELGVSYQLRNNADNSLVGSAVAGTGATIVLPTGVLAATTTFNVLATRGACPPAQLTTTVTVTVAGAINAGLTVTATASPICEGSSSSIQIASSESGVTYQLRNDADDSAIGTPVVGTGGTITISTGLLTTAITFNILASNGTCSIELTNQATVAVDVDPNPALPVTGPAATLCTGGVASILVSNSEVGVNYQLRNDADDSLVGTPVAGTGGVIALTTGALTTTTSFNVLATGGVCAPVELTTIVTVTVAGSVNLTLAVTADQTVFCAGGGTNINVSASEVGVDYQLLNNADDSPLSAVIAGTGGTLVIPTGNLTTNTVVSVLASNVSCAAKLNAVISLTVNPAPDLLLGVSALSSTVCFGSSTAIQVANSEVGVSYQLRNNIDNSPIGAAVTGTGSTLSLPTGGLTANTSFNVFASIGSCSGQLVSVVSITVLPSGDPLCAPLNNCATVKIKPIETPATCGALLPDGTVTFDIDPAVPLVNIIGVRIEIAGPLARTQFNNPVFTALPVGNYTYTIAYGDDTTPACIKVGVFQIESSGIPDPVEFSIETTDYNCIEEDGSITITGITGSADTNFTYTVYLDGDAIQTGTITADQAASGMFVISGLPLGEYQVQLTQDQKDVNTCVGLIASVFQPAVIVEPAGGCGLFVPNIFTPNGDNSNDTFFIRNLPANCKLVVTNRWGKQVYSSDNYQNNWNGDDASDGVYYYQLLVNGERYTGWVEIMRGN